MEWQPIDTCPRNKIVILYYPEKMDTGGRNHLHEMVKVDYAGSTPFRLPTHWMPLPEPPNNANEPSRET